MDSIPVVANTVSDDNTVAESTPNSAVAVTVASETTSNPWNNNNNETTEEPTSTPIEVQALRTPDPAVFDPSIATGLAATALETNAVVPPEFHEEVLSQFDPLAIQEEKDARDAWESSEAHPPQTPEKEIPLPSEEVQEEATTTQSPPVSASTFPSLAALARSFSIPTVRRPRPLSLDTAKPVPSPSTLSSFASQQTPANDITHTDTSSPQGSEDDSASPVPPPNPEPQFDFQKFLDQMKLKSAQPVAKYLTSFLSNFSKRTFTVNDQVKIISDFLNFISTRMRDTDVWKNATDAEFDNAMEGMEKLVMNRLYDFTFTPQVARAVPPRHVTADDLERDRVLSQRIALFAWIQEHHLDIPEGEGGKGFLMFAQQELLKINHYKAPRDKLICILNCCKVIFGLIRHLNKEEGADSFIPVLIYVVLKANPDHLLSNVEFINRFRNPAKLQSEAGYYQSSLMGAISFIETMDHTSLSNITQEEFEKNVEEAILSLPVSENHSPTIVSTSAQPTTPKTAGSTISQAPIISHEGEESAEPLSLATPSQTLSEDARRLLQKTGDTISKPLNAIGRIFSEALDGAESKLPTYLPGPFAPFELGRESREGSSSNGPPIPHWTHPAGGSMSGPTSPAYPQTPYSGEGLYSPPIQTPYKPRVRRVPSPSYLTSPPPNSPGYSPAGTPTRSAGPYTNQSLAIGNSLPVLPRSSSLLQSPPGSAHISRTPTPSLDLQGIQAQIDSANEHASETARTTLEQIFPSVDREVVDWVLEANQGDLGRSIEALLEISSAA